MNLRTQVPGSTFVTCKLTLLWGKAASENRAFGDGRTENPQKMTLGVARRNRSWHWAKAVTSMWEKFPKSLRMTDCIFRGKLQSPQAVREIWERSLEG